MNVIKIITWFYKAKYLSILLFSLLLPSLVFSSTFNVTTTQEFRAALTNSAGNGESDTINLAAGTYKTTDDGLGTFSFLDNEDFDLTIEGVDADTTILSGDDQDRVLSLNVVGSDVTVTIKKLSVSEGFKRTFPNAAGGGIYSQENILLIGCNLKNNEAHEGGGLYITSNKKVTIENSIFENNKGDFGGALYQRSGGVGHAVVKDSRFIANHGNNYGGAFYLAGNALIINSVFKANTSKFSGAINLPQTGTVSVKSSVFSGNSAESFAVMAKNGGYSNVSIINSIFYGNLSEGNEGTNLKEIVRLTSSGGITEIVNSAFVNNSGGVRYSGSSEINSLANTVFANNSDFDVNIQEPMIPNIANSFVPSITGTAFTKNILTEGDLSFLDIANNDFHLSSNSVLIDAGKNMDDLTVEDWGTGIKSFPVSDISGNQRISGASIDIGPYEFSTTRPTITKFDVEGVRKVDQVLVFVTDAAASSGRTIASYKIDNGSGTFVSASSEFSITYTTSGQRSVRVKVTDDQGEWTIKTLVISIVDLTLDQKIVAATEAGRQEVINSPSTYGLALASEIPVAREAGRQDVISSPSTYDLALASEIPVAREEQIAACLASPLSCGINIPNADIDGNGTQDALTDGLLILRYSFGLTGDSLISGVVAADATRKTAEEIEAYLETLMP